MHAKITLVHHSSKKDRQVFAFSSLDEFARKISQAQAEAEREYKTEFIKDAHIEVEIRGKNVPNVTFTDLMGLVNNDPNKTIVENIVKSYIERSGVLILSVLKADMDYCTHMGYELLKPYSEKTFTVFTFMDSLENGTSKEEDKETRLLNAIENTRNPRFCILGDSESNVRDFSSLNIPR